MCEGGVARDNRKNQSRQTHVGGWGVAGRKQEVASCFPQDDKPAGLGEHIDRIQTSGSQKRGSLTCNCSRKLQVSQEKLQEKTGNCHSLTTSCAPGTLQASH